jgi:hypothetical protein
MSVSSVIRKNNFLSKGRMRLFLFALVFSLSIFSQAQTVNWDLEVRQPIRQQILTPGGFLTPSENGSVNDSVGISLGQTIDEVMNGLTELVKQKGVSALDDSTLYVTGVAMSGERATKAAYAQALQAHGLRIQVQVLSIPKEQIRAATMASWQALLRRLIYFFPSITRDYQKPTLAEVSWGLVSSAIIEGPNAVFLYHTLPSVMDANITLASHLVIITTYAVYQKFMTNWLLRPGTGHVEAFMKQVLMTFPFVVNFNILGHFSEIMSFYQQHGWAGTVARFPTELATFATSQSLTIVLQTMFYNMVITDGIRAWENRQVGRASQTVRGVSKIVTVPWLIADAMVMTLASTGGSVLYNIGPMDLTMGHVYLAALTLFGKGLFWIAPDFLNPTLRWYDGAHELALGFGEWFRRNVGQNLESFFGQAPVTRTANSISRSDVSDRTANSCVALFGSSSGN